MNPMLQQHHYAREMPEPQVTTVDETSVVWRWADPHDDLDGVRLWSDFDLGDTAFDRAPGGWLLRRPRAALPAVDRLEYLFELRRHGTVRTALDPGNPQQVPGVFGDHSWVSLGYRPPAWLSVEPVPGERQTLTVAGTPVGTVDAQVWSPVGVGRHERLPLLLSHDGPEMDALGRLTPFVGAMIALGRLPATRVALLAPGPRDERYAANPAYAEALCAHVLPAVLEVAPTDGAPALMGQSLGALAALHAEWTHPGTFSRLLLQSGSFFSPDLDGMESGYPQWAVVTAFVATMLQARRAPSSPPVTVCFGTAEENAANNRQLAAKLVALGVPVTLGEVRDGHNFTCWRDLLDPHLTDLMALRQAQGTSRQGQGG